MHIFLGKRVMKEEVVLSIPGYEALVRDLGRKKYVTELLSKEGFRFIPLDNFIINAKDRLIATNDFRVIVKDHKGDIPEKVMLNIATVCYMAIGGLLDREVAYAYIRERMVRYGTPTMEFKMAGYVSVDLYGKNDIKYKSTLNMPAGKK
jgi:hypothetical protein